MVLPSDPHRGLATGPLWGTSVPQTPNLLATGKNPAGAHSFVCLSVCTHVCM